ncbi:MAG: hypothetical protein JWP50_940 [Phenylobacterium sp.]|nr:hypothetical protein [Phenylobacterium sp.]
MNVVAEESLDLMGSDQKVVVRLYLPVEQNENTWVCRFEIGDPIAAVGNVEGTSSLQALALGLQRLSVRLYSHPLYRDGKLGAWGDFGGYLGLPAPTSYLDFAPFEF